MANAFRKAANFLGLVDDEESAMAAPEVAKSESRLWHSSPNYEYLKRKKELETEWVISNEKIK